MMIIYRLLLLRARSGEQVLGALYTCVSLSEIPEILQNLKYLKALTLYFMALASFVFPGVLIKYPVSLPWETAGPPHPLWSECKLGIRCVATDHL